MQTLFTVLALVSSLGVIFSVMLQEGSEQSMGTITGSAEPLWGQSRGRSKEDVLKRVTIISAVLFIISHLVIAAL